MSTDRRWLRVLLIASLLSNLFLGGLILGRLAARPPNPGSQGWRIDRLTPDERARFDAAMAPYQSALKASRQAARLARAEAQDDIAAPAYDTRKVAADFAALRRATDAQQALLHEGAIKALGQISAESRARVVLHLRGVGIGRAGR